MWFEFSKKKKAKSIAVQENINNAYKGKKQKWKSGEGILQKSSVSCRWTVYVMRLLPFVQAAIFHYSDKYCNSEKDFRTKLHYLQLAVFAGENKPRNIILTYIEKA